MEKRKPNDLPPEQCLAVDTDTLCKLLCCGRHTAVQIGDLANARINNSSPLSHQLVILTHILHFTQVCAFEKLY